VSNWTEWKFKQSEAHKMYAFIIQQVVNNDNAGRETLKQIGLELLEDMYNKRHDPNYNADCFDDLFISTDEQYKLGLLIDCDECGISFDPTKSGNNYLCDNCSTE
jgi:hypothetical protein